MVRDISLRERMGPHTFADFCERIREDQKAAMAGDAQAQLELGLRLEEAGRDEATVAQSREWLAKAAQQGHVQAQYELGSSYAHGVYMNGNPPRAVKWLTRAARQGHAGAWLQLGRLYAGGEVGVVQDLSLARECYKKAEKNADGATWEGLGQVYFRGWHGMRDWPRAFSCYLQAAKAGDASAQLQLGQMYQYGVGTAVNPERAAYWYGRAVENTGKRRKPNDWEAGLRLAWCHEHGFGVPKNRDRALAVYRRQEDHVLFFTSSPLAQLVENERRPRRGADEDETPLTDDLELTLETDRKEYEVDEVVVIRVCCQNVGRHVYSFRKSHTHEAFKCHFQVRDEQGKLLPDPYQSPSDVRVRMFHGIITTRILGPGGSEVERYTLNQGVHLDRPGTYTITTEWSLPRGRDPDKSKERRRVVATPLQIKVRPCDPKRRQDTIDRLLEAYRAGKGIPKGIRRPVEHFDDDKIDIQRLLAFYCEPRLIPFFLDLLERGEPSCAEEALWGMPDRAAVIRAFEERLEHPEKYSSLALLEKYLDLIAPRHSLDWLEHFPNDVRRMQLEQKYRAKAMQVIRRDTAYRHPRLVAGLLGEGDDLFLINYLVRCHPGSHDLSGCASALGRVRLEREHISFLESLLSLEDEMDLHEAALAQLVRLDRRRYLPEVKRRKERLSREVVKVLLDGD